MLNDKRGLELTLNMIVLIVIALMVLIVAIIIFSGGTTQFAEKIKGVINEIWAGKPSMAGKCVPLAEKQIGVICSALPEEECKKHPESCRWQQ